MPPCSLLKWFRKNTLQSQSIFVPFGACAVPNQNLLYNCRYIQYIIILAFIYSVYIYIYNIYIYIYILEHIYIYVCDYYMLV